jgi:hypothetical protein
MIVVFVVSYVLIVLKKIKGSEFEIFEIGPLFFTETFKRENLSFTILPSKYFYPYHMTDGVKLSIDALDPAKINESYTHQLWGTTLRFNFKNSPPPLKTSLPTRPIISLGISKVNEWIVCFVLFFAIIFFF